MLMTSNLTAQGLTKYGEITNSSSNFVDKNGKTSSTPALNQSGAVAVVAATSVTIGSQTWTARNLDLTTYRNGDPIRYAGSIDDWTDANTDKEGAWCYYADAEGNNATYGKLYNWYAVNDGRGLAPAGWHVTSDAEWTTLRDYLGGESVAGGKLKEAGTSHWQPTNDGATNESGFTALPGGYRFDDGAFDYIRSDGFWWSSTEYVISYAWGRYLSFNNSLLSGNSYSKGYGLSVRCVQDIPLTSIAPISGIPNIASVLTAGALSPSGATATYQWTICSTVNGTYTNIDGATSNTYTLVAGDVNKFIKVVATASSGFTGILTSAALAAVPSVTIGTQTWIARNLDVSTYKDGTTIRYAGDVPNWEDAISYTNGAWCYYNNNADNNATYGKLYNWYAVNDARGLAPAGWHVASEGEWNTLATYLGTTVAAQKLKGAGSDYWPSPNTGATDAYGFTALPGGYCGYDQKFQGIMNGGYWWTTTPDGTTEAIYEGMFPSYNYILRAADPWGYGFSVRCLRD